MDLAEPAGGIDIPRLGVKDGAYTLASGLEDALAGLDRLHHGQAVGHLMGHRLLAVDVLARRDGVQRDAAVQVVGCGHKHCVHILAVEEDTVVAGGGDIAAPRFFGGLVARFVEVGGADADPGGHLARGPEQVAAANAGTDNGKANPATRGGLGGQRRRLEHCGFHDRARRNSARAQTHKIPPAHRKSIHRRLSFTTAILALGAASCPEAQKAGGL